MRYSDKDLAALISEVETAFSEHLAKAESTTNEADKIEKSEGEAVNAAEIHAETSESVDKSEKETETTKEFDYSEKDFAEMDGLYASMTKSEAEAHYKSIKKALFTEKTEEQVVAKSEKAEADKDIEAKNETSELLKSENDSVKKQNEELKKSNEELKKSLEGLTGALSKYVKKAAPQQKAITKIEYMKKSEDETSSEKPSEKEDITKLSKTEIAKRLTSKIRSGELKKNERDSVSKYYLDENKNIDLIKHLL